MKKICTILLLFCLTAALTLSASADAPLEYTINGTGNPEYGSPTSIEPVYTVDGGIMKNEDVSKNAALIPPSFGSPSADTLNTGTPLTPNLSPGYMPTAGAFISGGSALLTPPSVGSSSGTAYAPGASSLTFTNSGLYSPRFTDVTDDLYYKNGSLGTLEIPAIGLTVRIVQGTDSSALAKGAGHFKETSIWEGNVCLAAHNRGVNNHFGQIHTLEVGDVITLTTKLGTRTYEVTSVSRVSETDTSGLASTDENIITLYTCVRDQRDLRWCVVASEVV